MAQSTHNVSYGKPSIGGAISTAPLGTTLPTTAIADLSEGDFKSLGYVSEEGVVNTNTPSVEKIQAWGGDTVMVVQTSKEDTFQYTLIEALNPDVLREVYGADNVEGTLETGITVKANQTPQEPHVIVIDMVLQGGVLKRIVIPNGKIAEVGEVTYSDGVAIAYPTTIEALPHAEWDYDTHREFIQKAPASGG